MTSPLHTVHVRVNDGATGQPTPVRIRFTTPDGKYFAPFGRLADPTSSSGDSANDGNLCVGCDTPYAYIDGTCEISLPAGTIIVEISKGPEYLPIRQEVNQSLGKMALRFSVQRWIDLRNEQWYSGDTSVFFLSPHAALLEAMAEDVVVVNLLALEWWNDELTAYPNLLAFSGPRPALEAQGHLVVVNTNNTHRMLGSLSLLNCHRVVFPLHFGATDALGDWTLADWCDQCHRKGGLVVWMENWRVVPNNEGEALADLILGKVDALEIPYSEMRSFYLWLETSLFYALLNCGLRVPLVAGSRKIGIGYAIGTPRTYARLPAGLQFTYQGWIEAIRAGRTFVTTGPLLSFTVDGHGPGSVLKVPSADHKLQVRVEAKSIVPFDRLELVANGVILADATPSGSPVTAFIDTEVTLSESGWLAARCSKIRADGQSTHLITAHTTPVYVRVAGHEPSAHSASSSYLMQSLDRTLEWLSQEAHCDDDRQRERLAGILWQAKAELAKRLESRA